MAAKYIFVTGGVLSGVGKGVTAASMGALLKAMGLRVNIQKCDPYFNVDAGTLNPAEHGETFVTSDGAETDLDLGHYERFLDMELTSSSSMMSGRIFRQVIEDERQGKYLGKTVQIIPHVTDAMQEVIIQAANGYDVHIVEIGGTVGDYESVAFIEAIRQLRTKLGNKNCINVHVVYLPFIQASQEIKSKPAQNAVRELREAGIHCDILVARADHPIPDSAIQKLSLFSDIKKELIIPMQTVETIYEVPLLLEKLGIAQKLIELLDLPKNEINTKQWTKIVKRIKNSNAPKIHIGVVAKYLDHTDTYASVIEAIKSAAWSLNFQADIAWVNAEHLNTSNANNILDKYDGILVPGGFGSRGVEGKIAAAQYTLRNKKPYLGLCLGMQVACIGAVRLSGKHDAHSTEFNQHTKTPAIDLMESQKNRLHMGGTMRLGNYECQMIKGSNARTLYGIPSVFERHRHRYEFNAKYTKELESQGISICGHNPKSGLAELIEAKDHPFYMASQFHPEFNSRPTKAHPLFVGFIRAAARK